MSHPKSQSGSGQIELSCDAPNRPSFFRNQSNGSCLELIREPSPCPFRTCLLVHVSHRIHVSLGVHEIGSSPGFPFDDLVINAAVFLEEGGKEEGRKDLPFRLKVQKALPGRMLDISGNGVPVHILLARSPTEKGFVVGTSVLFMLLSMLLIVELGRDRLRGLDRLLAVAGYILGAAGFPDLIGVSRVAGLSALECLVFGLPLALLGISVAFQTLRRGSGDGDHAPDQNTDSAAANIGP